VPSLLLDKVLLYPIQHTTYFSSRGLLSDISRSVCDYSPTNHLYCTTTLGCETSDHNTTLSHTCWQVGFVLRSAPPVTLCPPALPLQEHKQTFFPTHLLHSYIHRSYQWTLGHPSEQACIYRLLRARACRTLPLWAHHCAYPLQTPEDVCWRICSPLIFKLFKERCWFLNFI
jgi:hypothetical protein